MRVAIYARVSTDKQNETSNEDQARLCQERAEKEGWRVAKIYSDKAISGASLIRPGVQDLLRDALAGKFDLILSEGMDRISRDLEDVAGIYKRMQYVGVRMFTLSEGEISLLHVGLKGTMNQLFLKDLADKTRRGIRGRVELGKSGGGNSFGYEVEKHVDEYIRGERSINEEESTIVCRIFKEYVAGNSPRFIAAQLIANACRRRPAKAGGRVRFMGTGIAEPEF